jgi:hypothetical protein
VRLDSSEPLRLEGLLPSDDAPEVDAVSSDGEPKGPGEAGTEGWEVERTDASARTDRALRDCSSSPSGYNPGDLRNQ